MKKLFKLSDVLPNPYRDLKRFPVPEEKIEALMESIETTGFWKNLGGREVDGKLQLASGHSRVAALRRKYKDEPDKRIEFEVEELSDSQMLQRMARENKKVYAANLSAVVESVVAAITSLGDGTIEYGGLPGQIAPVSEDTPRGLLRYAPFFIAGVPRTNLVQRPYTKTTLGVYLGYTRTDNERKGGVKADHDIEAALAFLENKELKVPGWDDTLLKRPETSTPHGMLKAAKEARSRYETVMARERIKAEEAKRNADSIQERLKAAEKAQKEAEAEAARLAKQREEALNKAAEEKAAAIKKQQEEAKQRAAEAEEKRKQAEKEWKANEKARQASVDAQRKAKEEAERRAQAQWSATVKSLIDQLDTLLSNEHHLYEAAKVLGRDKRLTDVQRKALLKAADGIHVRIDNVKRLINPDLNKKKK